MTFPLLSLVLSPLLILLSMPPILASHLCRDNQQETIWTSMSNESWHTSVKPKVQGSWNLHNSFKGKDSALESFLMTSSIAGSVGTATESNYTAANSFMDNFAKYRRKHNLPAVSIGLGAISEVGYLHENPEIEAVLLRKGITPIKEDEVLSIIDITLSRPNGLDPTEAHVLTGLETQGMKKLRRMGSKARSRRSTTPAPPSSPPLSTVKPTSTRRRPIPACRPRSRPRWKPAAMRTPCSTR